MMTIQEVIEQARSLINKRKKEARDLQHAKSEIDQFLSTSELEAATFLLADTVPTLLDEIERLRAALVEAKRYLVEYVEFDCDAGADGIYGWAAWDYAQPTMDTIDAALGEQGDV